MKITITQNIETPITLNLTKRELELLAALIGANSSVSFSAEINKCLSLGHNGVKLSPTTPDECKAFLGYNSYSQMVEILEDLFPDVVLKTVTFVYDKQDGGEPAWRELDVTEENNGYICGYDIGDGHKFKRFSKSKILGGKIITVNP